MRRLASIIGLLALAASPAFAGTVLYVTAASENRIDAFCVDRSTGALATTPNGKSFPTGAEPRRLLVAEGVITNIAIPETPRDVLYVALADRVQAFRILPRGGLESLGTTNDLIGMDPRDLVLSPGKNRLYVAQRGYNRVAAYDIQADGSLSEGPSTCAIGHAGARFVSLAGPAAVGGSAGGAFLYASSEGNGRVDVYPLDTTGNIMEVMVDDEGKVVLDPNTHRPTITEPSRECKTVDGEAPPVTVPYSSRRNLAQPKSMILLGEMLYVEERARARITGFRLLDGNFCDAPDQCSDEYTLAKDRCLERQRKRAENDKDYRHCAATRSKVFVQYENVVRFGDRLLGTQFFRGRVDSYRLKASSAGPLLLSKRSPFVSETDVRMTPVRALASTLNALRGECSDTDPTRPCDCGATGCAGVLYVSAGSFDRVVVYDLGRNGLPKKILNQTNQDKNSFPNDVALAVLTDSCD